MHEKDVELRSADVQEIIGEAPRWLVRWGITIFFLILCMLIGMGFMVSYPDIIKAPFRLSFSTMPKSVVAKANGKMRKLFIQENQEVEANQILGYLENTSDYDEVLDLTSELESIRSVVLAENSDALSNKDLTTFMKLGELQMPYQTFTQAYTQYQGFLYAGFYLTKKKILQKELSDLVSLHKIMELQRDLQRQDFELAESEYSIQKRLSDQNVIAPLEYQRETSKYITKKAAFLQVETALINNDAAQTAKQKEILELDKTISEQRGVFIQAINTMVSSIDLWKNRYLLIAPVSGQVHFSAIIQENQNVQDGQELFFIGAHDSRVFGEMRIPQANFGKVKQGQRVVVKFDSYPFQEYGVVEGKIEFISEIPGRDSSFLAKVVIPRGFTTTYKKKLTYRSGMNATAEIVTQDLMLIERVLFNFVKAGSR